MSYDAGALEGRAKIMDHPQKCVCCLESRWIKTGDAFCASCGSPYSMSGPVAEERVTDLIWFKGHKFIATDAHKIYIYTDEGIWAEVQGSGPR